MHSSVSARMAEQDEEDLQGVMQTADPGDGTAERTAEELYEWIEKSQIVCPVAAKAVNIFHRDCLESSERDRIILCG